MSDGLWRQIERLTFPPHCASCRCLLPFDPTGGEVVLCRDCRAKYELEKLSECPDCGQAMMDCRCMTPLLLRSGCDGIVRLAGYRAINLGNSINRIVNNLKRFREPHSFEFFARQLLVGIMGELDLLGIDPQEVSVTFSPRSFSARRENGFDQAQLLAEQIARVGGFPFERMLTRHRFVGQRAQKCLNSGDRVRNAENSFVLRQGAHISRAVILVDDVVTTGASLSVCTHLLKEAGAERVICACIASAVHTSFAGSAN